MPISTSVITGTVAHKHSATGGSSDGGKLATGGLGGDTSFDLATGSIMYSNGTSLDELVKASDGDQLELSGGLPAWVTPAGGSGLELIATSTLGSSANDITLSFSSVNASDVAAFVLYFNGGVDAPSSTEIGVRLEGNSSANYSMERLDMTGGTGTFSSWTNETYWKPYRSTVGTGRVFGHMYIQADQTSQSPNILMTSTFVGSSGQNVYSGNLNITSTSLSEVEIYAQNGGGQTLASGSTASFYKINL